MAAIGGADTGGAEIAAVGVGGIAFVRILQPHVVVVLASGQLELAFAVSHPNTQTASAEASAAVLKKDAEISAKYNKN